MQGYDILMLGVMAIAIMRGYSKGLAWQISSIASIAASYFVAYRFKDHVTPMIELADPWRGLVAMMILFVGTSLVIWFVFHNIRGAIEKAKLKDFDHQLGAIFGGVKGAAWCTVITIVALSFLTPGMSQQIVSSKSGGYIARLLANSKRIIPTEVQQVVQPYIQRAEDQLQDHVDGAVIQDESSYPWQQLEQTSNTWLQQDQQPNQWQQQPEQWQQPSYPPAQAQQQFPSQNIETYRSGTDPLQEFSNNGQPFQ